MAKGAAGCGRRSTRLFRRGRTDGRGIAALEFGLVAVPLLTCLLFVSEIAFNLFTQSELDTALQQTARRIQTGNAQNAKDGADFIGKYLCPDVGTFLACSGLYIKVQRLSPSAKQDYYDYTTGTPPVTAGALDLSSYASNSFCNSGPSQMLLVSAVYVGPSIVGHLVPGTLAVIFNGSLVHPTLSTVGIVTEKYSPAAAAGGAAAPC